MQLVLLCLVLVQIGGSAIFEAVNADIDPMTSANDVPLILCDPLSRFKKPVNVNVTFRIYNFVEMDDVRQTMSVKATFAMDWYDDCVWKVAVKQKPAREGVNDYLTIESVFPIWRPKIVLLNSATTTILVVDDNSVGYPVVAYPDGHVTSNAGGHWTARCSLDHELFPFDTQTCDFIFENWIEDSFTNMTKVTLSYLTSNAITSPTSLWRFISGTSTLSFDECFALVGSGNGTGRVSCWPKAVFTFTMARTWQPYVFSVFVPTLCLSSLQLASLAMPGHMPDRPIFVITLLLAFVVLQSEMRRAIPETAVVVILLVFFNASIAASTVITIYVTFVVAIAEQQMAEQGKVIERKPGGEKGRKESHGHYGELTSLKYWDYVMFWIFLIFYIGLYGIYGIRLLYVRANST